MIQRRGQALPVLVVEDNADTRDCVKCLLELEGYTVVTAGSGDEALAIVRSGLDPGLVVLDLMMPGTDGFHFMKEQTHDARLSSIPVVVCSGHPEMTTHSAISGAAACLQKPVDIERLLDLVN